MPSEKDTRKEVDKQLKQTGCDNGDGAYVLEKTGSFF
jgi:hypothetical protein